MTLLWYTREATSVRRSSGQQMNMKSTLLLWRISNDSKYVQAAIYFY